MRIRNNSVRVYSGAANTFRFKVDINDFSGGYAGIRSDNRMLSDLLRLGADGFSILYYQDVDSLVYWANEAAYKWKLRGIAIWSLGQKDMRVWEALPKQI